MRASTDTRATLCGKPLGNLRHVCALFDSRETEYEVLAPYVSEGLALGNKVLNIVDPGLVDDHDERLAGHGVDVEGATRRGQLEACDWSQTYLSHAPFCADQMVAGLSGHLARSKAEGFPMFRGFGNMGWAEAAPDISDELARYECLLNERLSAAYPDDVIVCVYDVNRFSGRVIADVISTHPLVIFDRRVFENPYYMQPHEFLQELERRKRARA